MATTSRTSCKRVEDMEIFQVLDESTDSDFTIFSSEDEEDGNEPDSDEDGQLDDNSETNEDGGTHTRGPHLNDEEERPDQQRADFDILYKARPALDLMDKFTQAYIPGCELAVDEAMIGFKGRFF